MRGSTRYPTPGNHQDGSIAAVRDQARRVTAAIGAPARNHTRKRQTAIFLRIGDSQPTSRLSAACKLLSEQKSAQLQALAV
jgi:hypothetical protein